MGGIFFSEFGHFLFETKIKMWFCFLQITVTYDETSEMANVLIVLIVFAQVCISKTECKSAW